MAESRQILWINLLRVVAMFGVVLLHVTAPLLYKYGKIPMSYWWTANIFDSAVRVCVPLFFMISGYFLLDKSEKLSRFITKRIKKVVVPLVLWSMVYIIWKMIITADYNVSLKIVYSIIMVPAYYHLWFIYALIGIYIFIPILRIFILNSNQYGKYYFVIIWFLIVSTVPLFESFHGLVSMLDFLAIPGFIGYLVLGHIIGHLRTSKKSFIVSNILFILSYMFTVCGTYYLSNQSGSFNEYFYGYLNPNIILLSATLFLSIKYILQDTIFDSNKIGIKIINRLSTASLGIYLVHPIFLYHLKNQGFEFFLITFSSNPILYIPIYTMVTFSLSFIVIWTLQKIPTIKRIVP